MMLRIVYVVFDKMAFLSQLDLSRAIERNFRRADIIPEFTHGFNPRPKFSFGPAKATGFVGLHELFDAELKGTVQIKPFLRRLNKHAPEGMLFISAREIYAYEWGKLVKNCKYSDYVLIFLDSKDSKKIVTLAKEKLPAFGEEKSEMGAYFLSVEKIFEDKLFKSLLESGMDDKIFLRGNSKREDKQIFAMKMRCDSSLDRTVRPERLLDSLLKESYGMSLYETDALKCILRYKLLTNGADELIELR